MERLSARQMVVLGGMYILDATLISVPAQIIFVAGHDAWLSLLAAAPVGAIGVWSLIQVVRRAPAANLFEVLVGRAPVVGRILTLLYVGYFFWLFARDLRMVADFAQVTMLPRTPGLLTIALLALATLALVTGGVEPLVRGTQTFAYPFLILLVCLPLFLLRDMQWTQILPVLERGGLSVLQGTWLVLPYVGEIIAIPFIYARKEVEGKHGLMALGLGVLILLMLLLLNLLALGPELSARMLYPNYTMVRQIRLTDFLDRWEVLMAGIYLPSLLAKLAASLYAAAVGLRCIWSRPNHKHACWVVAVAGVAFAHLFFDDVQHILGLNWGWPAFALVPQVGIPLLLWATFRPRAQNKGASLS